MYFVIENFECTCELKKVKKHNFLFFLVVQGVCHLLTNIGTYYKEAFSTCPPYELPCSDDFSNAPDALEYENMDLENFVLEKVSEEIESRKRSQERVSFHNHAPKALFGLVEGTTIGVSLFFIQEYSLIA